MLHRPLQGRPHIYIDIVSCASKAYQQQSLFIKKTYQKQAWKAFSKVKDREMSMKKSSTAPTMKTLLLVLGMTILVISTQFSVGECRALRAKRAREEVDGAEPGHGAASFGVSSTKNSSTSSHSSVRSFQYRLTSGPSKRGPGH